MSKNRIKRAYYTNKFIFTMCFLILGVFLMLQYKTAKLNTPARAVSYTAEIDELLTRLDEEIRKGAALAEKNANLVMQYDKFIYDYVTGIDDRELDAMINLAKKCKIIAGMTDVKGEGVTVTMKDANIRTNADPMLLIIHDMDIIRVLNELKAAGAQAVAVNGERILSASEIMCAGPTVRVNRNRYPVPYIIDALGDADKLAAVLESSLIYELLKDYDIRITIERKNEIVIRKYYGSIEWMIDSLTEVAE